MSNVLPFPKTAKPQALARIVPSDRLPGWFEVQAFYEGAGWRATLVAPDRETATARMKKLVEELVLAKM